MLQHCSKTANRVGGKHRRVTGGEVAQPRSNLVVAARNGHHIVYHGTLPPRFAAQFRLAPAAQRADYSIYALVAR